MYFIIALYHAWPTFRGHLTSELSTRPLDPISLWTLHSASGLHHSTDSVVITIFICVLVCANVMLCRYLLGPLALLDLMVSLCLLPRKGVRFRLISESSTKTLPITPSECSYVVSDICTLSWLTVSGTYAECDSI